MQAGKHNRKNRKVLSDTIQPGAAGLSRAQFWLPIAWLLFILTACSIIGDNLKASSPISTEQTPTVTTVSENLVVTPSETRSLPVSVTVTSTSTSMPQPTATTTPTNMPYGVVYNYETSDWTESDRASIRESLNTLRRMGVTTTVQTFSSRLAGTDRTSDWIIYLDEAEAAGIQVIARLWPLEPWDGRDLGMDKVKAFLDVVGEHPALLAYIGLHEPLETYDSDQMQTFYTKIKEIHPGITLAQYMGNMALFDDSWRFPNRKFSAGICDICIVWSTPARYLDGDVYLDELDVQETVRRNRLLVDERSPESELWYLGQAYALAEHRHTLRMPNPEEMETIFVIATGEGADGFLWYPWFHTAYDQVLGDATSADQRQAVKTIADKYLRASD